MIIILIENRSANIQYMITKHAEGTFDCGTHLDTYNDEEVLNIWDAARNCLLKQNIITDTDQIMTKQKRRKSTKNGMEISAVEHYIGDVTTWIGLIRNINISEMTSTHGQHYHPATKATTKRTDQGGNRPTQQNKNHPEQSGTSTNTGFLGRIRGFGKSTSTTSTKNANDDNTINEEPDLKQLYKLCLSTHDMLRDTNEKNEVRFGKIEDKVTYIETQAEVYVDKLEALDDTVESYQRKNRNDIQKIAGSGDDD